jgi:Zn-finger nucleic acid-binding protein
MKCPVDGETLVMADRNGVEIDYCPKCRGVWLDRGELDKIIDRAATAAPALPVAGQTPAWGAPTAQPTAAPDLHGRPPFADQDRDDRRRYDDDHDDDDHHGQGRRRRRGSFLGDLFDF